MNTARTTISLGRTGLMAGFLTTLFLIIYFMLMRAMGITGQAGAWLINFIILFGGINYCYRYYRIRTEPNVEYLPGIMLGTEVAAVSVITYTAFIYLYFSFIDANSLGILNNNILFMTEELTPTRAAFATFIEGLSSGIVISFIMMQYYKSGFKVRVKDM